MPPPTPLRFTPSVVTNCNLQESGIKIRLDKIFWQHVMACLDSFLESSLIPSLDSPPCVFRFASCFSLSSLWKQCVCIKKDYSLAPIITETSYIYKTRQDIYCKMEIFLCCQKCLKKSSTCKMRLMRPILNAHISWKHVDTVPSEWMGHTVAFSISTSEAVMEMPHWWSLCWEHPFRHWGWFIQSQQLSAVLSEAVLHKPNKLSDWPTFGPGLDLTNWIMTQSSFYNAKLIADKDNRQRL